MRAPSATTSSIGSTRGPARDDCRPLLDRRVQHAQADAYGLEQISRERGNRPGLSSAVASRSGAFSYSTRKPRALRTSPLASGERIGLAPAPARRLAGEALQHAADAIMAGRIIGAGVDVAGADRGADGAHGGRGGALVDPLGKVGGDGERIGWQRLVAGECGPF